MSGNDYLDLLFSLNRPGFIDISEKILSYLDYHSFVHFKRCCKHIYSFLDSNPELEEKYLARKLRVDWQENTPKTTAILTHNRLVSHTKLFPDGQHVACSIENEVRIFDFSTGDCNLILKGPHQATVNCTELIYDDDGKVIMFATGCREGVLAIWSVDGTCHVRKQLFGRITCIRSRGKFLVTSHFGKPFDAGCIMLREMNNFESMPVVFSLYEDIFPVISVDLTDDLIVLLEWSGTFNGIDAGYVNIYRIHEKTPAASLNELTNVSFSNVRFIDDSHLITGSHDHQIRLWTLIFGNTHRIEFSCTRMFSHHQSIITKIEITRDRAVTREFSGKLLVWDLKLLKNHNFADDVIVREVTSPTKMVTAVGINDRQICLGSIGSFYVMDFWSKNPSGLTSDANKE